MRKLGISIYPDKSSVQEMKDYIVKAQDAGFSRIFSCLLSVEKPREIIKEEFLEINQFAKAHGFEIIVDVSPRVFSALDISYEDLSFFHEIEADGIRLDAGFGGHQEALMTFNKYDLKIELNMSIDTHYIDTIMDFQPNQYNLIACHNFYPHPYSGLTEEHYQRCTARFKKHGLRTAAFVASKNPQAYGPWPVDYGLVTLESHRDLPIDIQMKDYIAMNQIDDIIISNFVPTDEEFEAIKKVNTQLLNLSVKLHEDIPELMKTIVINEPHYSRGDENAYLIRSTMSRVKYKGQGFPIFNAPAMIKRGDIVIESDEFGHYAGELNIAKQDMKNTGKSNVVGHIIEEEHFLLDRLKPWQNFEFTL